MGATTIRSNTVAAQAAIKQLTGVNATSFTNQTVEIGESNITAMKTGQLVNNQMMEDVSKFVEAVLKQAQKFPDLAARIEAHDQQDARDWG